MRRHHTAKEKGIEKSPVNALVVRNSADAAPHHEGFSRPSCIATRVGRARNDEIISEAMKRETRL